MQKGKKILSVLLCGVALTVSVSFSACDLSHKHYYNYAGVCNCGDDICETLVFNKDAFAYFGEEKEVQGSGAAPSEKIYYYFKFTTKGMSETGCKIETHSDSVAFDDLTLFDKNGMSTSAMRSDTSVTVQESFGTLETTYYIKTAFSATGKVQVGVTMISGNI